jgi:hypothetical protein
MKHAQLWSLPESRVAHWHSFSLYCYGWDPGIRDLRENRRVTNTISKYANVNKLLADYWQHRFHAANMLAWKPSCRTLPRARIYFALLAEPEEMLPTTPIHHGIYHINAVNKLAWNVMRP